MKKLVSSLLVLALIMSMVFVLTGCRSNRVNNVRLDGNYLHWDSTARVGAGFNIERRVYQDDVLITADTKYVWGRRNFDINEFEFENGDYWVFRVRRISHAWPPGNMTVVYQEWSSTYARKSV